MSADLVLDGPSAWAKAETATVIELPGPRASVVLSSADALGERVLLNRQGGQVLQLNGEPNGEGGAKAAE